MRKLTSSVSRTIASVSIAVLVGCAADSESFTTFPGFTEYFKQYTPEDSIPDERQQQLLEKYRPRFYRAIDENGIVQQGPVDFYKAFIADGKLLINGKSISQQVTPDLLNQHRDSAGAVFEYAGTYRKDTDAVVYGRFDQDTLHAQKKTYPLEFLSYNLVFPASGMIKGLGGLQTAALTIAGSLNDWHQLDHYVGLSIALYQNSPIAVTLQQHNYQTTYLINQDLQLPEDSRLQLDIAMRSNELYLHSEEETKHPAVSFVNEKNISFIMTGENKPFMAGYDVTRGDQEVDYKLQFLPQTDAFYQFKGHLGKSRLLPGRDGPPGADYATLPDLMPRAIRMVTGYRPSSIDEEQNKIKALIDLSAFTVNRAGIESYTADFVKAVPALD